MHAHMHTHMHASQQKQGLFEAPKDVQQSKNLKVPFTKFSNNNVCL